MSQVFGIGLGSAGLAFMVPFTSAGRGFSPLGTVLMLAASANWAGGSL